MNQYFMLIKNRFIDFEKLMIEKYYLLGLNETDAVILIKLNQCLSKGIRKLAVSEIAPTMSITANTISKRMVDLVNNGFITLTLSEVDSSEVFGLDETYKRLASLLEHADEELLIDKTMSKARRIATLIEQQFNRILTPMDLEVISHWVNEDNYAYEKIEEAVLECVKIKKMNLNYVEAILSKNDKPKQSNVKSDLQELFNNVYRKS